MTIRYPSTRAQPYPHAAKHFVVNVYAGPPGRPNVLGFFWPKGHPALRSLHETAHARPIYRLRITLKDKAR